jgi:hypothetical protein
VVARLVLWMSSVREVRHEKGSLLRTGEVMSRDEKLRKIEERLLRWKNSDISQGPRRENSDISQGPRRGELAAYARDVRKSVKSLKIKIIAPPLTTSALSDDNCVRKTWEIVAALDAADLLEAGGVHELLKHAGPLVDPVYRAPGISSYSFRRGLRELVDDGIIHCDPDPSKGERLPD